jgi:hypothetical protein
LAYRACDSSCRTLQGSMVASVSNIFVINVGRRMNGKTCAKDVYVGGGINTRGWSDARQSACPARLRSSIWVRSATPAPSRSIPLPLPVDPRFAPRLVRMDHLRSHDRRFDEHHINLHHSNHFDATYRNERTQRIRLSPWASHTMMNGLVKALPHALASFHSFIITHQGCSTSEI